RTHEEPLVQNESSCGLRVFETSWLEFQIQPCVNAVRWRRQRTVLQREDAIVDTQSNRPNQRDLHAAAGVACEAGVADGAQLLVIHAATDLEVRLESGERDRRL